MRERGFCSSGVSDAQYLASASEPLIFDGTQRCVALENFADMLNVCSAACAGEIDLL